MKTDHLLFGAAYYSEYLPYDRVEKDMEMMEKAGMNTIRIAESTWSTIEPKDGIFDFTHLDKMLEAAARHHISVIVGTPTYAIPVWLAKKYPESYDPSIPEHLIYSGNLKLTEIIEGLGVDAGKLVLSPTRTYAPIISLILKELRDIINGMVHCSGGAQTKVLHFLKDGLRAVKNNLFPTPPLFQLIQEQSQTDWKEMYRVFNMGHRMELYLPEAYAQQVIDISRSFNVDAQIVGHVEKSDKKEVRIEGEQGQFSYF